MTPVFRRTALAGLLIAPLIAAGGNAKIEGDAKLCVNQQGKVKITYYPEFPDSVKTVTWTIAGGTTPAAGKGSTGTGVWTPAKADPATVTFKGTFSVEWYDKKAKVGGTLSVNTDALTVQVAKIHKGYTEANPDGTSGLGDPQVEKTHPDNLAVSVVIAREVPDPKDKKKTKLIPNRMRDVADKLPKIEPGWCQMEPGSQGYDQCDSGEAKPQAAQTCPHCARSTLQKVLYVPTVAATAPAITIGLPTWQNSNEAGAWAQQEWARFLAALEKHEDNHADKYKKHCAAAKALIEAFAKKRFVGEDCSSQQAAGDEALKQFDDAKKELDEKLDALATAIAKEQKQYDADTKHGKTEGCAIDGDIPLLGDPPKQ
jgi:hypothetical protein